METKDRSGKLLFSINEVFSDGGYLKEKGKRYFNIPHYQRGYKWVAHNVQKLLTDIDNFEVSEGKFYCLQNITIVECDDYFNVIDGQQRLTTLSLILSFLQQKKLVKEKLRFPENSIRKFTNSFLNDVVTNINNNFPEENWESFIKANPEYDLQDIGHIFKVYRAIQEWFLERQKKTVDFDKEKFLKKFLDEVKLIVNEVDGQTSEEKVFGNLNSKRIPLDGSDLIRAILITRVAKEEGKKESDLKNIVYVNERRVKLGWELDQINNWWGREEVKGYFNSYTSIKSELVGGDKKLFNEEVYPINNLYLLFAESKGSQKLTLDLIEQRTNSAIALYKEVLRIHYTLQDWYEDKEIYHFLGFLFNVRSKKITFYEVWLLWESSATRSYFIDALKKKMRSYFVIGDDILIDFKDLKINWYDYNHSDLIMSLILMDIIHSIKENQPKLPYNRFWKGTDDVEHIFPQTPKEFKNKKMYIEFLNRYATSPTEIFNIDNWDVLQFDPSFVERLNKHIEVTISKFSINSIGNLVLLYRALNQSISNAVYSVKRSRIIEYHSLGNFIQPHTFKVFTRNFHDRTQGNEDHQYWTNEDIKRNSVYIDGVISNFFKIELP